MAVLSGLDGTITFAAGYTILARGWTMSINAAPQDLTPINPTWDHQKLLNTALLQSAAGSYGCRLGVGTTALLNAGAGEYDTFPEEWTLTQTCEAREVTVLGAAWRTYVAGLKSTSFEMVSYVDGIQALPLANRADTAILTTDAGRFYTVPYVVIGQDSGVDVDDTQRRVVTSCAATDRPVATGGLPLTGDFGVATFFAGGTNRKYVCDILVTGVVVNVNRAVSVGSVGISFVANGVVQAF